MKMNTALQCIALLAFAVVCTSSRIVKCRCVRTCKSMNPSLIADVEEYDPRPYCNKREVIAVLTDGSKRCLDPNQKFTQTVLRVIHMQRALKAMDATKNETTPAPVPVTPTAP